MLNCVIKQCLDLVHGTELRFILENKKQEKCRNTSHLTATPHAMTFEKAIF